MAVTVSVNGLSCPKGEQGGREHPMQLHAPPRRRQAVLAAAQNAHRLRPALNPHHRRKAANQSRLSTRAPARFPTP
jgi:hypothetical protein